MRGWELVMTIVGASLVLFITYFLRLGWTEEALRINIRASARISALCFLISFTASSVQYFKKGLFGFWMISNRKFFGISFAIVHLIHLLFLLLLNQYFEVLFHKNNIVNLVFGGIAYSFVVVMLVTSFEMVRSQMSMRLWKWIHSLGSYWVFIVFFTTIAGNVSEGWIYRLFLMLFSAAIALKMTKEIKSRLSNSA